MIEAKDLRSGNYVQGHPMSVPRLGFHSDGITKVQSLGIHLIDTKQWIVEPIILTEDILIKVGFESTRKGYWNNGKIEIGYTTTDEWFEYEYLSATSASTEMTVIKHLHQLQNLYYALTGTELIINL